MLIDAGAPADQVATHLLVMPRRGERWVVEMLREAARSALRRGAADSAVAYLRRALEEPPPDDLRELLHEARRGGGGEERTRGARAPRGAYEEIDGPARRAEVAFRIAWINMFTGSPDRSSRSPARDRRAAGRARGRALAARGARVHDRLVGRRRPGPARRPGPVPRESPAGAIGAKFMAAVAAFDWVHRNGRRTRASSWRSRRSPTGTLIEAKAGYLRSRSPRC